MPDVKTARFIGFGCVLVLHLFRVGIYTAANMRLTAGASAREAVEPAY